MDGSHERIARAAVGVAGAVLLAAVVGGGDAVRAADISDKVTIEKGREVFLTAGGVGCISCHGPYAEGNVGIGPYNRGSSERAIRTAMLADTGMEFLHSELSDTQIKQVAAYYHWLGQMKLVKTLAHRGRFVPDRLEIHPGTKVQLVVINADTHAHTFTSDGVGFEKVTIEGRHDIAVVWEAPESEGTLSVVCADCSAQGQRLTVAVTTKAEKFVPGTEASKALPKAAPGAAQQFVLTPEERNMVAKGRDLFLNVGEVGCAGCHGRYAEGELGIGSYNRGFSEASLRRALKTVESMTFLAEELGETEIKQIAAYYKSLAYTQLVKTMVVRGLFIPEEVRIHPGTTIQLVIINNSHAPRTFMSGQMGLKRFTVPAQEAADLIWTAPNYRGTFLLVCVDCPYRGQQLAVDITDKVPPYAPLVALK